VPAHGIENGIPGMRRVAAMYLDECVTNNLFAAIKVTECSQITNSTCHFGAQLDSKFILYTKNAPY